MKITEFRNKNLQQLESLKLELLKEQFNLRMQRGTGQLSKNHLLTNVRHDIARINLVIADKQKLDEKR